MFVGIIFQLAIMTLFTILAVDFMVRVVWDKPYPAQRWKLLDIKCRRRSSISTEEPKDELEGGAAEALGTNHIVTRDSGPSLSPANVTPSASGERPYGKSQASSTTEGKSQANSKSGSEDTTEQSSPPEPSAPLDPRRLRKAQLLLLGVAWATLMIYIRCIYRSIELSEGWSGRIITTERYFIWLDGLMMVLCMLGLAVSHPGFLLPRRSWGRPGPE